MPEEPQPQQPQTPYAVPVEAQTQAPGPVQYVVMQKSLEGLGGWLIFWVIIFILAGVGSISLFFTSLGNLQAAASISAVIFSPLLAIGYITSVVLISMRKKIGKLTSIITLGVSGLSSVANVLINGGEPGVLIAGVLTSLVFTGLFILYFLQSKRVAVTLTR